MGYPAEKDNNYTYEDYLKTPDDKKFELIEGELIMVPAPNTAHQKILVELGFALKQFIDNHNLGKVFIAPYDVVLSNNVVVQPDILFISNDREKLVDEQNLKGAPDLAIEIISSTSTYRDVVKKKKLYAQFGVKEYWIVYPEEEIIEVNALKNSSFEPYKTFEEKDTLTSPLLKKLEIGLNKIFKN